MTTLDCALEQRGLTCVDFVKIDAEGLDYSVLAGAEHALHSHTFGAVQFEYNRPWAEVGATLGGARRLLAQHGYRLFALRADGLYTFDYEHYGEFFGYANFVALSPAWVAECSRLVCGRL